MLRKRNVSNMDIIELKNITYATEYFDEILQKLAELQEIFERKEKKFPLLLYYNCFDNADLAIDYVLVYDKTSKPSVKDKVNEFIRQLILDGFRTEGNESQIYSYLVFIRIHCPREKLIRAGVALNMNLEFLSEMDPVADYDILFNLNALYNDITKPKERSEAAQRTRESIFNYKPSYITNAERIMVTKVLLQNIRYGSKDDEYGIGSMLRKKYLHTCFALHDGPAEWTHEGKLTDRQLLLKFWASYANIFKLQPLNMINRYFGTEVAFHFAFLGFFIQMLIIPSICGVLVIVFGCLTFADSRNFRSVEICNSNITICPPCIDMSMCTYEPLSNECTTSNISYIFDNFATSLYAVFWCLWSNFMYVKWKQREVVLMCKWDVLNIENVTIRTGFLISSIKHSGRYTTEMQHDEVSIHSSQKKQRGIRLWRILRFWVASFVIVMVVIFILVITYAAVIIRLYFGKILGRFEGQFSLERNSLIITTMGNLFIIFFICISEEVYAKLAYWVVDFEHHRSQETFEHSFVYKYSALCCITSYSFLFYTAFLKGRIETFPGGLKEYKLATIINYDFEKIHPRYFSVLYQWTMLTSGKEIWRIFIYFLRRYLIHIRRGYLLAKEDRRRSRIWDKEYNLYHHSRSFLRDNQIHVILQYGYLVLFSAAQPLGALAYLFYNLWLLRFEAKRILLHTRRIDPVRVQGLGPWVKVIKFLTILGMGTNVLFLAFSSNTINEICKWANPHYTNYIDFTFSEFAVDDYPQEFGDKIKEGRSGTSCYYKGNRFPPNSARKYQDNVLRWNIVSIQFVVVIVCQSVIIIICGLIHFILADIPHFVKERLKYRANLKENERIQKFKHEVPQQATDELVNDIQGKFNVASYSF